MIEQSFSSVSAITPTNESGRKKSIRCWISVVSIPVGTATPSAPPVLSTISVSYGVGSMRNR